MADNIHAKLLAIQHDLKVEKKQYSEYGGFNFRSKEDILEAAKPICYELGCTIVCNDDVRILENGWVYVITTALLTDVDSGEHIEANGLAREEAEHAKMDASQLTGSSSSYAGKRALGNLFALDDTADADADQAKHGKTPPPSGPFMGRCRSCGMRVQFFTPEQMAAYRCCPNPDYEVE